MDLAAASPTLDREGVRLLVVNSGDGLVHGLLGALFDGGAFAAPPPVADLAARHDQHDRRRCRASAAARCRALRACWTSPAPARPRSRATSCAGACSRSRYDPERAGRARHVPGCCRHLRRDPAHHRPDARDRAERAPGPTRRRSRQCSAARCAGVPARSASAVPPSAIGLEGEPVETRPRALVLATTLDRLVLGSRPFWHHERRHRSTSPRSTIPRRGWSGTPADPLRRRASATCPTRRSGAATWPGWSCSSTSPFTIDGEFFQPLRASRSSITAEDEIRFVKLRA